MSAPRQKVRDRLNEHHVAISLRHFEPGAMRAYYLATAAESPSCWPRVLEHTMTQERFHGRIGRMMAAIQKAWAA